MIIVTPGKSMRGNLGKHNRFQIPGDKSISHRAALLGAMTLGDCVYSNLKIESINLAARSLHSLDTRRPTQTRCSFYPDDNVRIKGIADCFTIRFWYI